MNYLQPSVVKTMHYPLEFRERRKSNYFQVREQWKITDFLFNPMVCLQCILFVSIGPLPKLCNIIPLVNTHVQYTATFMAVKKQFSFENWYKIMLKT